MSQARQTEHGSGLTFDFSGPGDAHYPGRRRAWLLFEIGVFLLVGAIISYAACIMASWRLGQAITLVLFVAGVIVLIFASGQSWKAWQAIDDGPAIAQVSVADNLLVVASRTHQKCVWYHDEIAEIALEQMPAAEARDGVRVILRLKKAPGEIVLASAEDNEHAAELARMVAVLQHAVFDKPLPTAANQDAATTHAIQVLDPETRISS